MLVKHSQLMNEEFVFISVPEVPYYVTVEAANSLGSGEAATTTAFTREGSKCILIGLSCCKSYVLCD